jgi:protein TonB
MLKLRTTTGLSALALLIGMGGTSWLSGLTDQWHEPSDRVAMVDRHAAVPRTPVKRHRAHGPVTVARQPRHVGRHHATDDNAARTTAATTPATLHPLATPSDTSLSWAQLRGHLDGRVIMQVRVDGNGRVASARVAASSGDPILDQHALRSVLGWRFAVPSDHPDGFSGELPMLFSSKARGLGML